MSDCNCVARAVEGDDAERARLFYVALSKWLNLTANDFYYVWMIKAEDPDKAYLNALICHSEGEQMTPNQYFEILLTRLVGDKKLGLYNFTAPDLTEAKDMWDSSFIILYGHDRIIITPYDNEIYHTAYVQAEFEED